MYARIAKYTFTGDALDIARRAEEGMLPIFQALPGFKAYTVVATAEKLISFSSWDSAESAAAADAASAEWVEENIGDRVELKDATIAEILFSTVLDVSTLAELRR